MDDNPFDKIHQASTRGHGVTLTHADVMLIMELLGDELGRVEAKLLKWDDIIKEYNRSKKREAEAQAEGD